MGKNTLVVRLGARRAAWLYLALALLAHGWLALAVWLLIPPAAALWGLASAPLSLAAALCCCATSEPQRLRPAIALWVAAPPGARAGPGGRGWLRARTDRPGLTPCGLATPKYRQSV